MPVHFISNSSAKIDNQKSVFSRQQSTTCARDYSRLFLDIAFGFHTRKPGGNYDLTISSDSLVHTRKIYFISVHLKYCLVVKNKHHQHRMYFSSGSPYRAKNNHSGSSLRAFIFLSRESNSTPQSNCLVV